MLSPVCGFGWKTEIETGQRLSLDKGTIPDAQGSTRNFRWKTDASRGTITRHQTPNGVALDEAGSTEYLCEQALLAHIPGKRLRRCGEFRMQTFAVGRKRKQFLGTAVRLRNTNKRRRTCNRCNLECGVDDSSNRQSSGSWKSSSICWVVEC